MVAAATIDAGPLVWAALLAALAAMVAVDLVLVRPGRAIGVREATVWSIVWLVIGLGFGAVVWACAGSAPAASYVGGYLVERSLSIDNVFVFALIMAGFGVEMLERVEWTAYLLGALLIVTGVRMVLHRPDQVDPGANPVVRLIGRLLPVDPGDDSGRVLRLRGGRVVATPLLAVLVAVATTDLIFAIDSVPAILAITREPLLLVAANAFAMLGLRSLYFCVAGLVDRFVYLAPGLAIVLVFIGLKMVWGQAVGHVPISLSLPVIAAIIGAAIIASLVATRGRRVTPAADGG
jgi:tellurite resistance protein TerC